MRFAYADPPYPGQSAKHYANHPDFAGEVDHADLVHRLVTDFDGWVLHTSSPCQWYVQNLLADRHNLLPASPTTRWRGGDYRVMAWVKPFAAFKKNVSVAYAWEPVLVKPVRKPEVSDRLVLRDYIAESITLKKGLAGVKPEKVCHWAFEVAGLDPDDEFHDLFPGSGAVTRAWDSWRLQLRLAA